MADVLKKVPVREQDPKVRATNFEEVCLGYNQEEAMDEATRCINCKNAKCIQGCPVSINVKVSVSAESKESLFPSVNWSDLSQIMHWSMTSNRKKQKKQMGIE